LDYKTCYFLTDYKTCYGINFNASSKYTTLSTNLTKLYKEITSQ